MNIGEKACADVFNGQRFLSGYNCNQFIHDYFALFQFDLGRFRDSIICGFYKWLIFNWKRSNERNSGDA